ncbi:uncharacterized protein E0L32_011729 [Thyridium curvatum]|uniref:Cytochrome P450 n=1 Tax=Thyridium curvatum TaxID=1093900 RepID=A0A507BHY6_9PEZI|nr:uncharacterized protein E0L32_011729 [Thyridium curvatum]TPX18354.1 hypothetical protein E0L32_011729 [Thyridium curvatum]
MPPSLPALSDPALQGAMASLRGTAASQAAFVVGISLHLFVFRIGEWDLATMRLILGTVYIQVAATALLVYAFPDVYPSVLETAGIVARLLGLVITGIWSSMLVYRGFFHRLCRFPGPFLARFSNFYIAGISMKKLLLHKEVQALHRQYGDYVRIGPSELSINDPKAVSLIHGNSTTCVKGPWYNVHHPMVPIQMIRDKAEHRKRRQVWDRGFSSKALRDYEPRVINHAEDLFKQIAKMEGQPINVTDWFNFYSFDVMGDLAFGKSFHMLRDGIKHYFMTALHGFMIGVGLFSHLLWLFPIFKKTPVLNAEDKKFWYWVLDQVEERKRNIPDRPDVFSWILESYNSLAKPTKQDDLNLIGDAFVIAVAGSDTTAATLSCLFYELAAHPECVKQLQTEVDPLFSGQEGQENDMRALAQLEHLNAVINEALRLHPPVPSGVQRMTGPEGLQIGDTFVPGNTIVQIPSYTMFRDERCFEQPDDFIPERWTTKKEMTKDASVFVPFSMGRYSCIGKQLGLIEIRYVTAHLIHKYNLSFAKDQAPRKFVEGQRDTFTIALPDLKLVFTPRS